MESKVKRELKDKSISSICELMLYYEKRLESLMGNKPIPDGAIGMLNYIKEIQAKIRCLHALLEQARGEDNGN